MAQGQFQDLVQSAGKASDAYVRALRTVYTGTRIPDPALAPRNDAEIWQKARRDPVTRLAIARRLVRSAGKAWRVAPPKDSPSDLDKSLAKCAEGALGLIKRFATSRALLQEAIFRGEAYALVTGERRFVSLGGLAPRWWWVPTQLVDLDKYRFEQRRRDDGVIRWYLASIDRSAWEPLEHPEWFVRHTFDEAESSLRYGRGLLDSIYFALLAKEELWVDRLTASRRWGRGMWKAKINSLRESSEDKSNEEVVKDVKETLRVAREDGDLIHGEHDEFELLEAPIDGWEMADKALQDINTDITRLVLSGELPTGGSSNVGSLARAEEEAESEDDLIESDHETLSETITDSVLALFYDLNRSVIAGLGLAAARPGKFQITSDQKPDEKKTAEVVQILVNAGAELRRDEVFERCGEWTPPKPGDVTLKKATPELGPDGLPLDEPEKEAGAEAIAKAFGALAEVSKPAAPPQVNVVFEREAIKSPPVTFQVQPQPPVHVEVNVPERDVNVDVHPAEVEAPIQFHPTILVPEREVKVDVDVEVQKGGAKKVTFTRQDGQIVEAEVKPEEEKS